jgi:hypothetical protein
MTQKSWRVTVTTAGTAVQGPDTGPGSFIVRGDPANAGVIYMGNDGADGVSATTGYILDSGVQVIVDINSMNKFWFDAAVSGDDVVILSLSNRLMP